MIHLFSFVTISLCYLFDWIPIRWLPRRFLWSRYKNELYIYRYKHKRTVM